MASAARSDSPKNNNNNTADPMMTSSTKASNSEEASSSTMMPSSVITPYFNEDQWSKTSKYFAEIESLYILGKHYPKPIGNN